MDNKVLTVVARKQDGIIFSGKAKSVTSLNNKGPFDILPMHENFVSPIKDTLEIIKEDGKSINIAIVHGIIHVKQSIVEIYLGI